MVQRGLATATLETGGSVAGNWTVPGGFFTPWSGTPTVFLSTTGVGWVSQPWTSFRLFKDGNASTPLLRPHINATTLQILVYARIVGGGTFSTLPRVELYDDAFVGKNWVPDLVAGTIQRFDRAVYTSATVALTGSLVTTTFNLPAEMLRGWEPSGTLPLGGIRNFGDLGLRVYVPGGPSNPGVTTCELSYEIKVQDTEPYTERTADFGVRFDSGVWSSVHYAGVQNNAPLLGHEYYVQEAGGGLNASNVLADAISRAGNSSAAYGVPVGTPVVVEIEALGSGPGAQHLQSIHVGGTGGTSALWKNASGGYRKIENLIVRSLDRGNNTRAQIDSGTSGVPSVSGTAPTGWIEPGHISFAGIRWFCTEFQTRCFETSFDMWSETLTLGMYDCHFTGEVTKANGSASHSGYEATMNMRLGYHATDFLDCRSGTAGEHGLAYGGASPVLPSQALRCRNTNSTAFYPLHPDPDPFPNGRYVRTFRQVVGRTNPCTAAGEGPAGYGTTLNEDCIATNCEDAHPFTMVGHLGAYINRRCTVNNPNTNDGGGIILWADTGTGAQDNQPKGHHSSLGQHDGPDIAISCNVLPVKPEEYPHTGTAYVNGSVLIEDFGGVGIVELNPIRTTACKSVTIRRGDFTQHPKLPTVWDLNMDQGNGSWGNIGPYQSLAYTLEHMGTTPQTYKGWRASTSQVAFGARDNPMGPQGGPALTSHILLTAHVNALKAPNTNWPPWRQGIVNITQTTVGGPTTYKVARVFPGMSPPTTYGTKHTGGGSNNLAGSSIIFPGRNTFSGVAIRYTPAAMQVGGNPGGGGSRIGGQGDLAFTGSADISANILTNIAGRGDMAFGGSASIKGAVLASGGIAFGGSALIGTVATGTANDSPMNVLFIDVDDMGTDFLEAAIAAGFAPNVARLRAEGMQFLNFWSAPLCSLFRARALTGLDAYRSGNLVGANLNQTSIYNGPNGMWITKDVPGIKVKRGKWHMSRLPGFSPTEVANPVHDPISGYDEFTGCQANLVFGAGVGYYSWERGSALKGFPGTVAMSTVFATNDTYRMVEADLKAGKEFISASFNAAHIPLDSPPNNQPYGYSYPSGSGLDDDRRRDLLRHLDFHLGCICDRAIQLGYIVIFACDNGTPGTGKGDMTESGIRTPMFVLGPKATIIKGTTTRLVQATDLWGTIRWLRGATDHLSAVDSRIFVDAFMQNQAALQAERQFLTCDDGFPLGGPVNVATWRRAIRDARWKLIDDPTLSPTRYFYDLLNDPTEQTNLFPSIPAGEATTAYNLLVANLQVP